MEKDTLKKYTYNELVELYKAIRDEIKRRMAEEYMHITEKPYGTD